MGGPRVLPFFLFTMGAAFPLAMRKRLDKGVSRWEVTGSLFRRWLTLTIFAIVLGNAYMTGRSTRPDWMVYVFNILLWGVMFMSLVRIKDEKKGKLVNNAGMFLLIVMAFVRTDTLKDSLGLEFGRCFSTALAEMPIRPAMSEALNFPFCHPRTQKPSSSAGPGRTA